MHFLDGCVDASRPRRRDARITNVVLPMTNPDDATRGVERRGRGAASVVGGCAVGVVFISVVRLELGRG